MKVFILSIVYIKIRSKSNVTLRMESFWSRLVFWRRVPLHHHEMYRVCEKCGHDGSLMNTAAMKRLKDIYKLDSVCGCVQACCMYIGPPEDAAPGAEAEIAEAGRADEPEVVVEVEPDPLRALPSTTVYDIAAEEFWPPHQRRYMTPAALAEARRNPRDPGKKT
ncbi:uncharacterized protein LOC134540427 [Bacillus rossius redtenbacheri]|uniref:uncharacterized protein LOC134540427 n=1 Tax=Bacillus rossius redtenbacheri TaxID=93214 RepID=UPI002FDEA2D5